MRIPRTRFGLTTRGVVAAALAATVAACSFGQEPDEVEPTGPWSDRIHYEPVGGELCERIRWDHIASASGLTMAGGESFQGSAAGPFQQMGPSAEYYWTGGCELDTEAEFLWSSGGELRVRVYEEPEPTFQHYEGFVEAEVEASGDKIVETVDGWWSEGTYVEDFTPGYAGSAIVWYHIYDENLFLSLMYGGSLVGSEQLDREDAVAHFDRVATALLEEVRANLPCRSLVDPPATECP